MISLISWFCLSRANCILHGASGFKGSDRQPQADARPNVTISAGHDHDTQYYNTMVESLVDHGRKQKLSDFARERARFEKEG